MSDIPEDLPAEARPLYTLHGFLETVGGIFPAEAAKCRACDGWGCKNCPEPPVLNITYERLKQLQEMVPEGHVVVPAELIAAVRRMLYAAFMAEDLEDYAEAINVFLDKMPPPP